jgi:hypothetical protein
VAEGTLTTALVHPAEVFAPAIRDRAAALILVHNHPSGDPTPSSEDVALTDRLRQVGEVVGIPRARPRGGRARAVRQPGGGAAVVTAAALRTDVFVLGHRRRHVLAATNAATTAAAATGGPAARAVAAPAAAQELDALGDHLGDVALLAFLVVVLAAPDRALDEDLAALVQVLAAALGLLSPDDDVVPLGAFLLLPLLRGPRLGGRDRKRATARPLGVNRSSGSLPRFPISITLLSDIDAPPCGVAGP